ncbi:MAG TPA: pitrilysin family protein, partial [Candidatus Lustribacter sp.]|nr:pitrilysin family protein [Candidatus Lustribacter sp.]
MSIAYPIEERRLPNGLRVVVSEDHTVPTVTVSLWVGVGSRHEVAGRTGFAHLFEHLMFQGSRHVASGEHMSALMAQGSRLNATTWFDRTNYFETVPKGALELALWLEADRHGYLLDALSQENLDNQRDVVKEEKRQRYDNVPYGTALIDVYATLFPPGHPYHHATIGSMEDLDAASLDDVHAFYRRYYGPSNSVLTLVGDVSSDEAFAAVERYFGDLPASAEPPAGPGPQLEPLPEPARLERRQAVPASRLYLAFRLPVDATPEFYAAALAIDAIAALGT